MTTLVTLRPGLSLEAEAAASWARMESARGRQLDVNRSTVSRAAQQKERDKYLAYRAGTGPWAPLALDPDDSWHCLPRARAVDTDDDAWIRAHPEFGWRFVVPTEKWHAQYYPGFDRHRGQGFPAGGGGKPIPENKKARSSMATLYVNNSTTPPTFALAGDGQGDAAWIEFTDQQLANALVGFHGISQKAVPLGAVSFREWRDKYRSG